MIKKSTLVILVGGLGSSLLISNVVMARDLPKDPVVLQKVSDQQTAMCTQVSNCIRSNPSVRGPQGPMGPAGPTGPAGPAGCTGEGCLTEHMYYNTVVVDGYCGSRSSIDRTPVANSCSTSMGGNHFHDDGGFESGWNFTWRGDGPGCSSGDFLVGGKGFIQGGSEHSECSAVGYISPTSSSDWYSPPHSCRIKLVAICARTSSER